MSSTVATSPKECGPFRLRRHGRLSTCITVVSGGVGPRAEAAMVIAVGAGTGLAIDFAIDLPRTVYVRDRGVALSVEPRVLPGGAALRLHARF
jgi:hypothetical protein